MQTYEKIAIKIAVILVFFLILAMATRGGLAFKEQYLGDRGISGQTLNGQRFAILHYTEWCSYCKRMKPIWEEAKHRMAGKAISMQENDEDKQPTAGVNKYPTIYLLDEYGHKREYHGPADLITLTQFLLAP